MKRINLTKGFVAIVDDADFDYLNQFSWHSNVQPTTVYADRKQRICGGSQIHTPMHRMIVGALPHQLVDHRDGNGLNNRRSNLRICDVVKNGGNRRIIASNNTSGFKGVSFHKPTGKWVAYIGKKIGGKSKMVRIGGFDTPILAAVAYNDAASEYFGPFAKLNPIPAK